MESQWASLPQEILETLGLYLDAGGWAAARLTTTAWTKITHGVQVLCIDLERDAHRWMMVLTCVARLFPRLSSVALLCGSRITAAVFAERMAALAITFTQLQELELRFLYLSNPQLGTWLEDLSGVTELRGLSLLRLAGGATPSPSFFEGLVNLKQLKSLEVLPGVYGQIVGNDMDMGQAGFDPHAGAHHPLGVRDEHLSAIGKLTQLQQLTCKACPYDTTAAGLAGLTALGLLHNLQHLALYDAELPCSCLAQHLAHASKLTSLQFGLNSVSRELSTLRSLPNLQEIGLDTAFLPSIQELVDTAASVKLPPTGPHSITSLCLLDQVINSGQQLACLSQLSGLAELVLVNPLMQAPAPAAPAGAEADAEAEGAAGPQQQQQQQQLPVDLSALSGLSGLRLLQLDVGQRSGEAATDMLQTLSLQVTDSSIRQLAGACTALETLDLSGFGPDMLQGSALTALSCFKSLRSLSVMHPEGLPELLPEQEEDLQGLDDEDPPLLPAVAAMQPPAAGSSGSSGGSDASKLRSLPWWHLPSGLVSLCLSHFDLTGRGSSQCGLQQLAAAHSGGSNGGCCCLAAGQQQLQQRQLLPSLGLGLSLFQNRPSPLRPLSKRRRQTQQRVESEQSGGAADAAGGGAWGLDGGGLGGDPLGAAAAAAAGGQHDTADGGSSGRGGRGSSQQQQAQLVCSCATELPARFTSLQALWLEHVSLPPAFLPRVLPGLATSLESLALLHVTGTQPQDMAQLGCLTALTSLRLIPTDHDVGGLEPLLAMKHLKRLVLKLTHLRPSDLPVLHKLRSLFCLSLSAPCVNGVLYPGFASAVRWQQVEEVVHGSLPYCDVELQPEPNMTALP